MAVRFPPKSLGSNVTCASLLLSNMLRNCVRARRFCGCLNDARFRWEKGFSVASLMDLAARSTDMAQCARMNDVSFETHLLHHYSANASRNRLSRVRKRSTDCFFAAADSG